MTLTILGAPNRGFRFFTSTMARTIEADGPFGREQRSVLPTDERAMKSQDGRRANRDGDLREPRAMEQEAAHTEYKPIDPKRTWGPGVGADSR